METTTISQTNTHSSSRIYNAIVEWSLALGIFLLPVFFLPWTTSPLEFNKQLLLLGIVSIGLIAWLLNIVSSGKVTLRRTPFDKAIVGILAATLVTAIFSQVRSHSFFGVSASVSGSLMSVAALTILFFLATQTWHDRGAKLKSILLVSMLIALWYGLLQMLGVFSLRFALTESRAFNSIGAPNTLGILAAVSLPLFLSTREGWLKFVALAGSVAALALVIILNWWVLWAIAVAGMVAYILLNTLHGSFRVARFVLPMTVIVLGVFLSLVKFDLPVKTKLPVEVGPSATLSYHIVESVLREKFFTGYGPENFSLAFNHYGAGKLANTNFSSAEFFDGPSEAINQLVQGGIVALAAWALALWSLIQALWYVGKNRSQLESDSVGVWASMVALVAAFCLYPFNLSLMFMLYAVAALGMLTQWGGESKELNIEDNVQLSLASSLGFIGGLIVVLVGVYFGVSAYLADLHYAKAITAKNITTAAQEIDTATQWNKNDDRFYRAASQISLGLLSQELNKPTDAQDTQRNTRIQNYLASAVNFAKTATEKNDKEVVNWDNLGVIYQNLLGFVSGVDQLAETAYRTASQLRPGDVAYYNKTGILNLNKADLIRELSKKNPNIVQTYGTVQEALQSAEDNFKKAIELSNNFGMAIYNLGTVYEREGKLPEAIRELEKIAPFNNNEPSLLFELGLLYYRAGNKNKAFDTLQRVLVLSPDFANAHWYLALVYEERKDIPAAMSELEKILSVEANKGNQTVIQKLNQLKSGNVSGGKAIDQKPL